MKPPEGEPLIWKIDGSDLEIKYPGKLYWPDASIKKTDLLIYYRDMAQIMLPYFKNRPVTLHYFPKGIHNISFYKRNFSQRSDSLVHTAVYHEISQKKDLHVPVIDSKMEMLWLASKGCIEFHLWNSKITHFQYPDWIIFDLDIHKDTAFNKVLKGALILKEELLKKKLKSFPKTSGGTGLHIYVPVRPEYTFETIRNRLGFFITELSEKYPDLISAGRKDRKTHIGNRITIDIMQNVISRNTAAPYTVRGFPGAPVSAPLTWKEVEEGGFLPTDLHLKNIPRRIKEKGDVFSDILKLKQELTL